MVAIFVYLYALTSTLIINHQEDSKVFGHARYLEQFFEQQLSKWLPQYSSNNGMGAAAAAAAAVATANATTELLRPASNDSSFSNSSTTKRQRTEEDVEMIS